MLGLIIFVSIAAALVTKIEGKIKCGYNSCHPTKKEYVNVHIIAHSHNDVGWLKTVDEYYDTAVQKILTSTFEALLRNKDRRFIYAESAFFFKWWNDEQTSNLKHPYRKLINNGQFEFVGGGWTMNDEATTNYQSIIDQFTLGLSKLNDTFGVCGHPKVGWQIDTFGHSNEMASIFRQLGFDGLFLGRIHYKEKKQKLESKTMEMVWQGSKSLGRASDIFTSVLFNTYYSPDNFCFDPICARNDSFKPNKIEELWDDLIDFLDQEQKGYQTNNIMVTMGGDFHYQIAENWFDNLDKLISYGNAQQADGSQYHFIYSTPSCYLKAVHEEAVASDISWQIRKDDFFPYATNKVSYWTGFYTSRPTLKRFERIGNNFLQICKQLYVLGNLTDTYKPKLDSLREAMGVLQHHDAISGTSKQYVVDDYVTTFRQGFDECGSLTVAALNNIMVNESKANFTNIISCTLSNLSQCEFTESSTKFVVTIYNSLGRSINHYVRVPVTEGSYIVKGPSGQNKQTQLLPVPEGILKIPGREYRASWELVFRANKIPALGFKSYHVEKIQEYYPAYDEFDENDFTGNVSVEISDETGLLSKVNMNGKSVNILQQFLYYRNPSCPNLGSDAYVFYPTEKPTPVAQKVEIIHHQGQLVDEIHQTFNEWVSQVIRTYKDENYVEFDWLVGPLPQDEYGREVISRFSTKLVTETAFYTDSNGRDVLERLRNIKLMWKYYLTVSVPNNYYPVTSKILVRDPYHDVELAVLTDRPQGGSSLEDGQIELMIHRNTVRSGYLGLDEPLNEKAFGQPTVVRGSHYLVFGPFVNKTKDNVVRLERDLAQRKLLEAWTFLSPTELSYEQYKGLYKLQYSGLKLTLPKNVNVLTLEPWKDYSILLRLEHVFAMNEDRRLSKPVTINLKHLFAAFKIVDVRETTLGANQWLDESKPIKFQRVLKRRKKKENSKTDKFNITLKPMQIRTFIVQIDRST